MLANEILFSPSFFRSSFFFIFFPNKFGEHGSSAIMSLELRYQHHHKQTALFRLTKCCVYFISLGTHSLMNTTAANISSHTFCVCVSFYFVCVSFIFISFVTLNFICPLCSTLKLIHGGILEPHFSLCCVFNIGMMLMVMIIITLYASLPMALYVVLISRACV